MTQLTQRPGLGLKTLNLLLSFSIKVHWREYLACSNPLVSVRCIVPKVRSSECFQEEGLRVVARCVNRVLGRCDLVGSAMGLHLCHLWIVVRIYTPCLPHATFTFPETYIYCLLGLPSCVFWFLSCWEGCSFPYVS